MFSIHLTEQELPPFWMRHENIHPKKPKLLQINFEILSQQESIPNVNKRATNTNRDVLIIILLKYVQINQRSLKNLVPENHNKNWCWFSISDTNNLVSSNAKKNNTETTESVIPTKVTKISIPRSSTLIPVFIVLLKVPPKTIRSTSAIPNVSNISDNFESPKSSFGAISHQFQVQNTAPITFVPFNRTQKKVPL